ncbi:MAG: hypothetical protein MUC49_05295 [Raineya sp.]|jgi:hypothetical protein|nr:hypothetical protein [Raineya sp.]
MKKLQKIVACLVLSLLSASTLVAQQKSAATQKATPDKLQKIEITCNKTIYRFEGKKGFEDKSNTEFIRLTNDSIFVGQYTKNTTEEKILAIKVALKDLYQGNHSVSKITDTKFIVTLCQTLKAGMKNKIVRTEERCSRLYGTEVPSRREETASVFSISFASEAEAKKFLENTTLQIEKAYNEANKK